MKTQISQHSWGIKSVSFWSVLLLASAIIFIGIRFIIHPQTGALGYGIAFENNSDVAYGQIKGIRDIFSGIVLLPLLWMRMRKAVAWVFTASIVVPAFDFLIILFYNGSSDAAHLLIHGITALVMATTSFLLFYGLLHQSKNN
ncbi:DUF4267 domain-containing protein [Dyadobacter sp. CY356]|uniref:DUF4267 domain-containing protein n=1 Tax=Dyadobacter sp. CY356 TaxID=2906442 RepID=UPI001F1BB0AA|nr:DUF4267 domain-containing protein [Dyadobacter sp. CY356]MCF0059120.1 DUF4267 domain-containing protein [Dyadobacter sp. CY356]